ncbi:hypothetical protein [Pseudoramibacter sp.]|jgi:hypothetical protein|uniref:hypothetical protein n=1 Tax=Pseudoramibacter sp. TaxID=2034862 RepID=UPI00345792F9
MCYNLDKILFLKRGRLLNPKAHYHLPGLFEHYEFYKAFLEVYRGHPEYFYDWCDIGSVYGAPAGCLWGGGRVELGDAAPDAVFALMDRDHIPVRLTFSNLLLEEKHLDDPFCNALCEKLSKSKIKQGIIVASDLLTAYLQKHFPELYLVSSTTKVITDFNKFKTELNRPEFAYTVPDFRLNNKISAFSKLSEQEKSKVEFLCNECCDFGCTERAACYRDVSRKNLGLPGKDHVCTAPGAKDGYRFSKAMANPGFIGVKEIQETYRPMGFSNFKIEGRGLGSALLLEFILSYMVKPEYQIHVREALYLDNALDLF